MKKFIFSLQTVLNLRQSRENDALSALGAAQRAYQAEVARKLQLQTQLADALARREELGRGTQPVLAFRLEQEFINGTKVRITHADQAIMRASRGVEKALRAYLTARRQTRMIEILREKAFTEYRRERAKQERKQLDELMITRARLLENSPVSIDFKEEIA